MPLWDLCLESLLQLFHPARCRFGLDPFEGWLSFLVGLQILVFWFVLIDGGGSICEPSAQMRDKSVCGRGQVETLTILGHLGFTLRPAQELTAVIGKLFRSRDTQIARFEFGSDVAEDTGFQMFANITVLPFMLHTDGAEPLLTDKREIQRGVNILATTFLMGDEKVYRINQGLIGSR